ncbi:MAG TPA: hypothetical protein EYM52_00145 [Dehalococcoidia bacterium]|nr:hypothetical protein [Dehalococcoidia bacterium]
MRKSPKLIAVIVGMLILAIPFFVACSSPLDKPASPAVLVALAPAPAPTPAPAPVPATPAPAAPPSRSVPGMLGSPAAA